MKIKFKNIIKFMLLFMLIIFLIFFVLFSYYFIKVLGDSKDLVFKKDKLIMQTMSTQILDNNGNTINNVSLNGKSIVKLNDLKDYTKNAFISIEDKSFYKHNGFNYKRILKAIYNNLKSGYTKEGASTISQQLIKNTHLTNEKTIERKIKEYLLTRKLEKEFSKNEILEIYLNAIYFGNSCYGIENASKAYFDKSAKDLSVAESALLAGVIKSPQKYNPNLNIENSIARRNLVLKNMFEDKYIDYPTYTKSLNEKHSIHSYNNKINAYESLCVGEASKLLNITENEFLKGNFRVWTYFDANKQTLLEKNIFKNNSNKQIDNALILKDNDNNSIVAITYNGNYDIKSLRREAGSTLKPFISYGYGLEKGKIHLATKIKDEPINYISFSPSNANGKYLGDVTVREALAKSINTVAVKQLEYNGINNSINFAKKFGFEFTQKDNNLSIALGSINKGITFFQLADAYSCLANGGMYAQSSFIKKIESSNGTTIYENKIKKTKACSSETAYLLTDALKSCSKNGTAKMLSSLNFNIASKTGTVGADGGNLDAYNLSYTPEYTLLSWIGNTTGKKENNLSEDINGGTHATQVAKNVWNDLAQTITKKDFEKPNNIKILEYDKIDYNSKNIITITNQSTPQRHKLIDIFNEEFAPKILSNNFVYPEKTIIEVDMNGDDFLVKFQGDKYHNYEIYLKQNDMENCIKTIRGTNGKITEKIEVKENGLYEVYVKTVQENAITGDKISSPKSNIIKIYKK